MGVDTDTDTETLFEFAGLPRFGSVRNYGSCMERFEWFRFSVLTVPPGRGFLGTSVAFQQKGTVPVPVSVPEKRFRRFRFEIFGSYRNGSDSSGFRFQFGRPGPLTFEFPCVYQKICINTHSF